MPNMNDAYNKGYKEGREELVQSILEEGDQVFRLSSMGVDTHFWKIAKKNISDRYLKEEEK